MSKKTLKYLQSQMALTMGEDLGINDKMNDSNKYALAEVSPWGRFRGAVSWQSWRAATRNPVEALRYE